MASGAARGLLQEKTNALCIPHVVSGLGNYAHVFEETQIQCSVIENDLLSPGSSV
jgi:hypothetical protein